VSSFIALKLISCKINHC